MSKLLQNGLLYDDAEPVVFRSIGVDCVKPFHNALQAHKNWIHFAF